MLTADQITALGDKVQQYIDPIVDFLIEDIARRISEAGQLTSTAAYQVWRLQQLGVSQSQLKKRLKKLLKVTEKQLQRLLTQAAKTGYDYDLKTLPHVRAVPFRDNEMIQNIVNASIQLAQEDLSNMVQTIGFVNQDGICRPLTEAYQKASDFAFQKVATGVQDYNSAVREATRELLKKGIRTIDYESGVHTALDAALRRNVLGGLGLMQEKISQQNHDALGCDGWEISAHAASAPDHEPIQGKQYSDEAYKALNDSLVRRIGTLNCGHSAHPIIMGVNRPQYTPEELERMRQDNAKGIEYEGKHYTMYQATQRQRELERAIRSCKRRILAEKAAGDGKRLVADQTRLVRLQDEYVRFSKAAGLRTQNARIEAAGFGPKQTREAEKASAESFTLQSNRGIIKAVSGARITNVYGSAAEKHAEKYYGLVRSMTTDVAKISQNTGYSIEEIQRIKNFIFYEKHDLGGPEPERFAPSFSMAQSWQRLLSGKMEPHDLTMLRHEIYERQLMDAGTSQYDAHIEASKKYNYAKECDDYYAALKERKNRK